MIIEFFFDTACPWCYIGKRRLEQALNKRKKKIVKIKWCSLLLNPDLPPSGVKQDSHLSNKYGRESRIYQTHDNIIDIGLSVNIDFNFNTIRQTPNTIDTHRLVHFAHIEGKAEIALEALFQSYFVEGKNIGDTSVLMAIAKGIGIDVDAFSDQLKTNNGIAEIYASNSRAHILGITGMPSFVFNKQLIISGAQEPTILARMLDAAITKT